MVEDLFKIASQWWRQNVLELPKEEPKRKTARVKVKVKRAKGEKLSDKEYKAIKKTLSGPFGRMDKIHPHDDIQ